MTHLLREELVRWRDQGLPEDRKRVITHLATCKACADAYAELVREAPATQPLEHFNPADFVKWGYAARKSAGASVAPSVFMSWKLWAGALSAAAVVVLIVATGPDLQRLFESSDGARGAGIELTAPTATGGTLPSLEWKTGLTASRYRVELTDPAGTTVYQAETNASSVTLPANVATALLPGASYTWRVTALDRDGQAIATATSVFLPNAPAR
jgi:hypothetical protein